MKIKISHLTLSFLLLCSAMGFAQTSNVEELKKEVTNLQHQLSTEKEKTVYFKKVLDIRNSGNEITIDSLSVRITEVKGNLTDQTISIKGLITYKGNINRNIQFPLQEIIDPNGNSFESYVVTQLNNPSKDIFIQNIEKDIPYGFNVIFSNVNEKFPTANLLRLQIYGHLGAPDYKFNFKGVDISWQ